MKRILFILALCVPLAAAPAVTGTFKANGKASPLRHGYADVSPNDVILLLTDNPMPPDRVPFGAYDMATKGEIRGLMVMIDKKSKKGSDGALYHQAWEGQLGMLEDKYELKVTRLDDQFLEGTIRSKGGEVKFSDYTYAFEAAFKVSLAAPPPPEVTFRGATTPEAKAYETYYRAMVRQDVAAVKKLLVKENAKMLDGPNAAAMLAVASARPPDVKVLNSAVKGETATLTVEGTYAGEKGTGSVVMVKEDGVWKVRDDKWRFGK